MATPELIKLVGAGSTLVMLVDTCGELPFGDYKEVEFVGMDDTNRRVALRIPKSSTDRQLGRLEMVYTDAVGKRLIFSRDPNTKSPDKPPYWGINLASGAVWPVENGQPGTGGTGAIPRPAGTAQPPAPPNPAPATSTGVTSGTVAQPHEHPSGAALYRKIAKWYLDEIVPLYIEAGVPVTHEGCGAGIAALYIQANKQ